MQSAAEEDKRKREGLSTTRRGGSQKKRSGIVGCHGDGGGLLLLLNAAATAAVPPTLIEHTLRSDCRIQVGRMNRTGGEVKNSNHLLKLSRKVFGSKLSERKERPA